MTWSKCVSFAVFLGTFAVYLRTLYASIPGGDTGELLAESCHLGQAHPPGYPLFTLLNHWVIAWLPLPQHLFSDLTTHSPAWKANALSALWSALSVGILCRTIELLTLKFVPEMSKALVYSGCVFGSLTFAFSELVWQYSVGAEVFALNNFFVSLLLYLTLGFAATGEEQYVSFGALLCGLALTNHHMIVLLELPIIMWMFLLHWNRILERKTLLLKWAGLFCLGLIPYLYLPIVSTFNKQPGSWGDSSSLPGLLHHVRRGDYGTLRLYSNTDENSPGALHRIGLYIQDLCSRQGFTIVPVFAAVGVCWTTVASCGIRRPFKRTKVATVKDKDKIDAGKRKRKKKGRSNQFKKEPLIEVKAGGGAEEMDTRRVGVVIALANMLALVVFHYLANIPLHDPLLYGVQARFWLQPNMVVFLFSGCGYSFVFHKAFARRPKLLMLAIPLSLGLVGLQIQKNFAKSDQSSNKYMEEYGRSLLETLPLKSLFLTNYDNQWTSIRYLQRCLGFRPDVVSINLSMMTYNWWGSYRQVYEETTALRIPSGRNRLVHTRSPAFANGEGFNMKMFLDANVDQFPGGMYFGGPIPYTETDDSYSDGYTTFTMGLLKRIYPSKDDSGIEALGFDDWLRQQKTAWAEIDRLRPYLPNTTKYDAETWEWTTVRDYFSNFEDYVAALLEEAIRREQLELINEAAYSLERAFSQDEEITSGAVKNLGLAYLKLVQLSKGKLLSFQPAHWLQEHNGEDWKSAASVRVLVVWSHFLSMKEAKKDADYPNIKSAVDHLKKAKKK